jgi:pimeloyl-ACP methyl ester carboxylesterase
MHRLQGLRALVHDAIDAITDLVEETHEASAQKPVALLSLVEPLGSVARGVDRVRGGVARAVFDGVRGTNRGVQAICDQGMAVAARALAAVQADAPGGAPRQARVGALDPYLDPVEGALNGLIGDYLAARGNPLAARMSLRHDGRPLPLDAALGAGVPAAALPAAVLTAALLPAATGKLVVFVHGLACYDSVWSPSARAPGAELCFGAELARELGYTALYLRYNTGLHISENGRALALLLADLERAYPVALDEIALVGHSMGGLVARSAAHYGQELGLPWLGKLTHVLGIGAPHFGAPLARAGQLVSSVAGWFDSAGTQVPAKVLRARSAGIKDLSFGSLLDGDWFGQDTDGSPFEARRTSPPPFVARVAYGYVAARYRPSKGGGPFGEWLGDLLVQLPSASGLHRDPERRIPFHMGHVVDGAHHAALTTHPEVYRQLRRFLEECRAPSPTV